jgi:uncharacterized membrane protein YidH (DUF202 family)
MGSPVVNANTEKKIEFFARFGIVAKGIVYVLAGALTALASFGFQGKKSDKTETLQFIYDQPLGSVLLFIIAAGLAGYAMWRFFQAIRDIDHKGNDAKGKFTRLGYAFSGVVYLSLSFYAIKMDLNGSSGGSNDSQRFVVNKIFEYEYGKWIIGAIALIILFNGIRQIYKGVSGKFLKNIHIDNKHADLYKKTGIAGYISRGFVLLILAYFFLRGAIHANANEIGGTKGAFNFIENTYGSVLLGVVALGLICYGIFMFVKARFQKIDLNF